MVALVIEGHAAISVIRAKGAGEQGGNLGVPIGRQVDLVNGLTSGKTKNLRLTLGFAKSSNQCMFTSTFSNNTNSHGLDIAKAGPNGKIQNGK